jgi:hypothetical protein
MQCRQRASRDCRIVDFVELVGVCYEAFGARSEGRTELAVEKKFTKYSNLPGSIRASYRIHCMTDTYCMVSSGTGRQVKIASLTLSKR